MYSKPQNKKTSISKSGRKHAIIGTPIRVGGRVIGQVIGDTCFKDVSRKKHFLHYPQEAIAFQIDALHAAHNAGAVYVDILDTDNGIHYKAAITEYFEHGEKFNYGWGEQLKLTLPNFAQSRDPEYTAHTHTDAPAYGDSDGTHEDNIKPLHYKSRATVGIVWNGKKVNSVKQLDMFGKGGKHE